VLITNKVFEAYLNCKTKAHLTFGPTKDGEYSHPIGDWQQRIAEKYRANCADRLQSAESANCFVGNPCSEDLRNAKYQFIIQPYITAQDVGSNIHALEQLARPHEKHSSLYIPIRFEPFEKVSKHQKLMLAFDAFVLWKAFGQVPTKGTIIHGLQQTALVLKLDGWIHEVESLIGKLRTFLTEGNRPDPVLIKHCKECIFETRCRKIVTEKDGLSLLDGLGATERAKLNTKGILTVTQLAYTFRPRRRPKNQALRKEKFNPALRALAIRDRKIHVVGTPELQLTGTPVFLDVEGLPDRDFYYLIGLRIHDGTSFVQCSLWADEPSEEQGIWRSFFDILRDINDPVLIHYGAYETSFLKRLASRYPALPVDAVWVDGLIKRAVNLLATIYAQIYFPTYSNGLKEVARYLGFRWSHPSSSGLHSLIWRQQWEETFDPSIKQTIRTYNKEDCEALELVTHAVEGVAIFAQQRHQSTATCDDVYVHSEDIQKMSRWRKFTSSVPALEVINEAAHWNYQRDRVYVRNGDTRRSLNPSQTKPRPAMLRVNKTVVCSEPSRCPVCCGENLKAGSNRSRIIHDLRFGKTSVKRWIVKYQFRHYECLGCGGKIHPPEKTWGRGKYGWNLIAFLIYEIVELCVPQLVATRQANRLFGLTLPRSSVAEQKSRAARRYEETRQGLFRRITEGTLVHADETPIVTEGKRSFVWVFCNFEEVVYFYSENREAGTMQTALKDFKGVLVSDFYSAYDSMDCPQQKSLIHLMRDLNDDMLKNPFDDDMRQIVQQFGALLRPIIDTVDQRGLKKRFLKKHLTDVERFYRWLFKRRWQSDVATKCKQRFEKNREKLFTFLSYDGVPWNNNNAEHAVKAFAALRDVSKGRRHPQELTNTSSF
jgi:predicted RecB family nuclease